MPAFTVAVRRIEARSRSSFSRELDARAAHLRQSRASNITLGKFVPYSHLAVRIRSSEYDITLLCLGFLLPFCLQVGSVE